MSDIHSNKVFTNDSYHSAYWVTANHGVAHIDANGFFLDANESFCSLVGYTRAELLTMNFQSITDTIDLHADVQSADDVILGKTSGYGIDKNWKHKVGYLIRANVQVRRVPTSKKFDFEHFVVHAYKKPPISNVKHEVDKKGELQVRTTTTMKHFFIDNKIAMMWIILAICLMGFVSGNLPQIIELIIHLMK